MDTTSYGATGVNLGISGSVIPLSNNTYSLGTTGYVWAELYVGTGSVHIGDVKLSSTSTPFTGSTGPYLITNSSIIPNVTNTYTLGASGASWKDLFVGPGTINIQGPVGAKNVATIGSDLQGIVYTQYGFASPFLNVGPEIYTDQAVGGWQIIGTGYTGANGFVPTDLYAQINGQSGPTGPAYSLIFGKYGPTGYTGPQGTFGLSGTNPGDYIYWNGTDWSVGDTQVSIGAFAGQGQGTGAIAIGSQSGNTDQNPYAIAIGQQAGQTNQGNNAVAIGINAGNNGQESNALAIGAGAGEINQGMDSVAFGVGAGNNTQGYYAVAMGYYAGNSQQGNGSIAIGYYAGATGQTPYSIVLNASSRKDVTAGNTGFFVNPIRATGSHYALNYDPVTSEITYSLSLTGPTGYAGANGSQGVTGFTGPQGLQGPTGTNIYITAATFPGYTGPVYPIATPTVIGGTAYYLDGDNLYVTTRNNQTNLINASFQTYESSANGINNLSATIMRSFAGMSGFTAAVPPYYPVVNLANNVLVTGPTGDVRYPPDSGNAISYLNTSLWTISTIQGQGPTPNKYPVNAFTVNMQALDRVTNIPAGPTGVYYAIRVSTDGNQPIYSNIRMSAIQMG